MALIKHNSPPNTILPMQNRWPIHINSDITEYNMQRWNRNNKCQSHLVLSDIAVKSHADLAANLTRVPTSLSLLTGGPVLCLNTTLPVTRHRQWLCLMLSHSELSMAHECDRWRDHAIAMLITTCYNSADAFCAAMLLIVPPYREHNFHWCFSS